LNVSFPRDTRYFGKPYYIVRREVIGQESFAVIRDAMSREGVTGLARVVLSSRERPFLVEPMGAGLRGVTLRLHTSACRRGLFQRSSEDEASRRDDEASAAHYQDEVGRIRSLHAGGSLSHCACAHSEQKAGKASRARARRQAIT
jgi:hypothetical protein